MINVLYSFERGSELEYKCVYHGLCNLFFRVLNNMAQTMQKAQNSRSYAFFRVQLTLKKCSYKKTECSSKWKCIYHGLSGLCN